MAADGVRSINQYRGTAQNRVRNATVLATALSVAVAILLFAFPPGWLAVLFCVGVAFTMVTWWRPVLGVALVLLPTLLFEQFEIGVYRPLTLLVPFFSSASATMANGGFKASPLEVMLAIVAGVVTLKAILGKAPVRPNPLSVPVAVLSASLVAWLAYGLLAGGALSVAVWELRAPVYFCLVVLIVPQVLASERDVRLLLWVAIAAIGAKSLQGVWNYFAILQISATDTQGVAAHEDAVFMAWMVVFLVALLLYRTSPKQRAVLLAFTPFMAFTFVKADRRAAYAALGVGLVVLAALVMTDRTRREPIVKWVVPVLLAVALTVAVGWDLSGPIGFPARVVRSIVAPQTAEDIGSSHYRVVEELNLMQSIRARPLMGLGFGRPFQQPGQNGIAILKWEFADVIAHNSVFWIWAVMGTLGFALFWAVFGGLIAFGGVVFRTSTPAYHKAVAGLVTAAVAMQLIVSTVDLQLTYARNMVFLGVLVGMLATLPALENAEVASASE